MRLSLGTVVGLLIALGGAMIAQTSARLQFDVASVKPSTSNAPATSRFPLGPGDAYIPGNLFSATNQPLIVYLRFAYKLGQSDLLGLQGWVYNDGIDIEARAPGNPTKDRMRFMIQSLLVDRFKLVTHTERRTKPVFTLLLAKPEKIGPQLQKHLDDGSCFVEARPGTSGAVPPIAIVEPSAWVSASAILFMVALLRPTTTDPLLKLLSACRSLGLLFKYLR